MPKISCFKIKKGKQTKIPKNKCSEKSINSLLKKGFTVSKVTEVENKIKIETFSPKTRTQALKEHRRRLRKLPFS